MMRQILLTTIFMLCIFRCALTEDSNLQAEQTEPLQSLAEQFVGEPQTAYRPGVWWHWLGSNFRKEGITKDFEAMKEAGIGTVTLCNIASSVQNSHTPMKNNPFPEQTFRGEAYWDALKFSAAEAKRLGMKMGMMGTPGYATTGGPWVNEERSMKILVYSNAKITGNGNVEIQLLQPEAPVYRGFGTLYQKAAVYKDIAVMAVPIKEDLLEFVAVEEILDISASMDKTGLLRWNAPKGDWHICRVGYVSTMANPHPLPDDIIGKSLEVDKLSREHAEYLWQQVLEPLKKHLKEYIGDSFTYIWIDSYEAGEQNWTDTFREDFIRIKGYDPLPAFTALQFLAARSELGRFTKDQNEVINRLMIDNHWKVAKKMINDAGLKLYWEPYTGPFSTYEAAFIPDVLASEFWTSKDGLDQRDAIMKSVRESGRKIVAAEAFTGRPEVSRYTEDPAFLKHSADSAFVLGANMFFLHHWVHQPFDDKYQPGMGMGWWGTHFSRHQTWIKPGKAFFTYLARCQMLLQQGNYGNFNAPNVLHRTTPDAEFFFVTNPSQSVVQKTFSFPVQNRTPELWDAYHGSIRQTPDWNAKGNTTNVDLTLGVDESVFVVFPKENNCPYNALRSPFVKTLDETYKPIDGEWGVSFQPKLEPAFRKTFPSLADFSKDSDARIKYFAGTASYEKLIPIDAEDIANGRRVLLDLGDLHDIAELEVNDTNAGVLWHPPYKADITALLKAGENKLTVRISVNWANRLIGDEQEPADFEWGTDRGPELGRGMKSFPDWFVKNQPRPSEGRKTFNLWYYYRKDSPLQPAGLLGPVQLMKQKIVIMKG